jgi:16S rRNA (cytosine967-C5)-methyltransferase
MPASPARAAAFDILLQVEQEAAYASELLHAPRYAGLTASDHGLTTELVMGVLRWQSLLDKRIAEHSSQAIRKLDPQVLIALRMAVYQLLFLDRVPQRAAVHESVELVKRARKRSAVPFANAVLRKCVDVPDALSSQAIASSETASDLSDSSAHPLWFVERWVQRYGLAAVRQICLHNQQQPQTAVRVTDPAVEIELQKSGINLSPGRLLTSARRVISGDVTNTPAFREGRISVQDEASQLVAILVGKGENILDCCAAPGGKTRVMADRSPTARILAAEIHPHRARLLRRLVPAQNVEVMTADISDLPTGRPFDRVLADVPCSGTGTLARNPEIKWRLKPEDLADLRMRQQAILKSAMAQVAPGGRLVYSTCSLEREENEDVVEAMLAETMNFKLSPAAEELTILQNEGELAWPNIDDLISGPYLRTLPGTHPCDGFFAAVLKRD